MSRIIDIDLEIEELERVTKLKEENEIAFINDEHNQKMTTLVTEREKLIKEFKQKVKSPFRGVDIQIDVDYLAGISVSVGETSRIGLMGLDIANGFELMRYYKGIFRYQNISEHNAEKIRDLYIEYFGKPQ